MRAGTAYVSTDVETGTSEVHLYLAHGERIEVALEIGEHSWLALHRAFDASGMPGNAFFQPRGMHLVRHNSDGEHPQGVLLESFECLTVEVAS